MITKNKILLLAIIFFSKLSVGSADNTDDLKSKLKDEINSLNDQINNLKNRLDNSGKQLDNMSNDIYSKIIDLEKRMHRLISDQELMRLLNIVAIDIKCTDIASLLKNGTNIKDVNGNTALMLLIDHVDPKITDLAAVTSAIRNLKNSDFDAQNNKGETVLIKAVKRKLCVCIIEEILKYTQNINLYDSTGSTALMWATWKFGNDSVNLLLSSFADVNIKNKHGESFLDFLRERPIVNNLWQDKYSSVYDHAKQYQLKTQKIIYDYGIFPNDVAALISVYHLPIESLDKLILERMMNRLEYSERLVFYSGTLDLDEINDINVSNGDGTTALMWAVRKKIMN